jgi:hypothetical protein
MATTNPSDDRKAVFSIDEFCRGHDLSRATFYILQKTGRGPRLMRVGTRVLISVEAAADWRRRMETEAA